MPVVCPSCDVAPPADAAAGAACNSCGTPLVTVKQAEDLTGQIIDQRFEILAPLGKGGMGTVYRARQRSIGRDVALKLIDRRFEEDVTAVKRFLREAKLASALVHPNTVGVIEFGQSPEGRLYLAMELVRGRTLLEIAQGGLPLKRIVRIGVQLCDALEAAHALAIVHRDLKLENVMVLDGPNDRDHVKVLDFGLARSLAEVDSRATATGLIAGTPRYLPPEVAVGGAEPAPAQDMYSLGVILGELATGAPLWDAPTLEALFALKLEGSPRLDRVPPALRPLVERLLDTRPDARPGPATTREALLALDTSARVGLEPTRQITPVPTPAPSPARSSSPAVSVALPSAAFAPPEPELANVELEEEWQREKAAKIAAANAPPPKRPLKIWGIVIALAIVAIVAVVVVILATGPKDKPASTAPDHDSSRVTSEQKMPPSNSVQIEVRSRPRGDILFDGKKVGSTPKLLYVPKSTREIEISVTMGAHTRSKTITPDHDQTVDFTYP